MSSLTLTSPSSLGMVSLNLENGNRVVARPVTTSVPRLPVTFQDTSDVTP